MKALLLAIALLNAAPKEQDRLILDLYDMDPRLVAEVLDVVDELGAEFLILTNNENIPGDMWVDGISNNENIPGDMWVDGISKDENIPGDMWVDGISKDGSTKAPSIGAMF